MKYPSPFNRQDKGCYVEMLRTMEQDETPPRRPNEGSAWVSESRIRHVLVICWGPIDRSPHVITLLNFLIRQSFRVTVVTIAAGSRPLSLDGEAAFVSLDHKEHGGMSKIAKLGGIARRLRRLIRGSRADVLYAIDSWSLPPIIIASAGNPRMIAPVFIYHTFDWLDPGVHNRIHLWYERWASLKADLCVNVDRSRARLSQSFYRLPRLPLCIPNFPLLDAEKPERDERLREELLGMGGRALVICPSVASASRLHLELLRAVSLLPPEYRLVTFSGQGQYDAACRELANGLGGRVQFLAPCAYEELANYLSCADVGLILNNWKGSSGYWMANSGRLANFLQLSVPVVTSNVPNLEALVYRYGLGESCDAYDPASIADAIRSVVEGPPGIKERRNSVWTAYQTELHFERRGVLLSQELHRLCKYRNKKR